MNKQTLNEIIELSQECISRFWQLDVEYAVENGLFNIKLNHLCT